MKDRQMMFLMSFLSELGSGLTGYGIESILHYVIRQELSRLEAQIGRWQVVWGPAAFQFHPGGLADNVMFAAYDPAHSRIVVAISGTNPNSYFDWFILDWDIGRTVRWPYGNPPTDAAVSRGSWIAMNILQSLRPPRGLPGAGLTVEEFLPGLMRTLDADVEIILTGHSLGGAVSPAIALWLMDTQPNWDRGNRARVSCYAYAGPTTGNSAFATYAGGRLGDCMHRVANSLDVSPMGWSQAGLERSKTAYAPVIFSGPQIRREIDFLKHRARRIDYQHIDPDAEPLPGRINTSILSPIASQYENYLGQQSYQHSEAYFELLGIHEYINYQSILRNALKPLALGTYCVSWYLFEYLNALDLLYGE